MTTIGKIRNELPAVADCFLQNLLSSENSHLSQMLRYIDSERALKMKTLVPHLKASRVDNYKLAQCVHLLFYALKAFKYSQIVCFGVSATRDIIVVSFERDVSFFFWDMKARGVGLPPFAVASLPKSPKYSPILHMSHTQTEEPFSGALCLLHKFHPRP